MASGEPQRVIGMAWYRRVDYPRILEIMEDADGLHATFRQWLASAERAEKKIKKSGLDVVRVMIDPDAFAAYCAEKNLKRIGATRAQYACEPRHVEPG